MIFPTDKNKNKKISQQAEKWKLKLKFRGRRSTANRAFRNNRPNKIIKESLA